MQHPVAFAEPFPALMHHPPRPDRAMRMAHRLRPPRRARSEHRIGQPVGIAHLPGAGGQPLPAQHLGHAQHRAGQRIWQRHTLRRHDQRRPHNPRHARDLCPCQRRRCGHRHQTRRDGPQKQDRKGHLIAQPHQHPVPRLQAPRQQPRPAAPHRRLQPGIAPAFRPPRTYDLQRHPVGMALHRSLQHMTGQVERRGAGRPGALVDLGLHPAFLSRHSAVARQAALA